MRMLLVESGELFEKLSPKCHEEFCEYFKTVVNTRVSPITAST